MPIEHAGTPLFVVSTSDFLWFVDAALAEMRNPPRNAPDSEDADLPISRSQGAVLLHIYEELAQHLGQMQLTRDILLRGG